MRVHGTLSPRRASGRSWDALVVGAGPGGSLAARELARAGHRVLLVDRSSFPRAKVCGGCLHPHALRVLESVGLGGVPDRLGAATVESFTLLARGRGSSLALPGGRALSRESLDAELVREAVAAGADFLPSARVTSIGSGRAERIVRVEAEGAGTHTIRSRLVVCASGLSLPPIEAAHPGEGGGALRTGRGESRALELHLDPGSRIGAGLILEHLPRGHSSGTVTMACGRGGYVGLCAGEGGRLLVGAALDPHLLPGRGGLGPAVHAILTEAGAPPVPGLRDAAWRGTPALTRRASSVAAERLFLVGDAASYVEPFTGEGMSWALEGSAALAGLLDPALRTGDEGSPDLVAAWRRVHRHRFGRRRRACGAVARLVRRPRLVSSAIALADRVPGAARTLVRLAYGSSTTRTSAAHGAGARSA